MPTSASTGGWIVALISAVAVIVAAVIGILPQFLNNDEPARQELPIEEPSPPPVTTSSPQLSNPPANPPTSDRTRAVPDVTGLHLSQAINRLQDDGFEYRPEFGTSATVAMGQVIRTEPPANTKVEKGTRVTLVVSSGRP